MTGIKVERKTKETDISVVLDMADNSSIDIKTDVPFLSHLLHSFSFHGGFSLIVKAKGDIEVDPHHLVEDCGLVIGSAFLKYAEKEGPLMRFGQGLIPMDEALSEAVVDVCGRPYLVYEAEYPQPCAGSFDLSLLREFLLALSSAAKINLHAVCRRGQNGHHMAEALFKAMGKAFEQAYKKAPTNSPLSTKGKLL